MKSRPCWRFIVSVNDNVFPAYIALGKIALEGKLAVIRQFSSGGQGKFYSRRGIVVVRGKLQDSIARGYRIVRSDGFHTSPSNSELLVPQGAVFKINCNCSLRCDG